MSELCIYLYYLYIFACFRFEFSLANDNVNFVLIGRWHYFGFVFLRHSMKTALIRMNQTEKLRSKAMPRQGNPRAGLLWPDLGFP